MRHLRPILLPMVLATLVAACSAPSTSSEGNGDGSSTAAGESEGSQPTDGGGGGTGDNPPIADGQFTGGSVQASVSGAATLSLDLDLAGGITAGGATSLTYANANGGGLSVVLTSDGNAITFTSTELTTAGGTADVGGDCAIVVTRSDASGVAGTINCRGMPSLRGDGTSGGEVNIEGTFDANR